MGKLWRLKYFSLHNIVQDIVRCDGPPQNETDRMEVGLFLLWKWESTLVRRSGSKLSCSLLQETDQNTHLQSQRRTWNLHWIKLL